MPATIKAHLLLFLVTLIFSANYSIAKIVMDDDYLQPLGFILLRVLAAMTLFWLFHLFFVRERVRRRDLGLLFLCGLFGVGINQPFFFTGLRYSTPINASLILTTSPILVLLISAALLGEAITRLKLLGILLGAAGAITLIAYGKSLNVTRTQMFGDLLIVVNASSYGLYLVLVKKLMSKYHPVTVVKWVFTFGFLMVLPLGYGEVMAADWSSFSTGIWLAIGYVLVFTTFLAYLLNAYALTLVSPSVVSIYIYLQPFLTTLIALAWGKDQLTAVKVAAGLLIFAGVYLVSLPPGGKWRMAAKKEASKHV